MKHVLVLSLLVSLVADSRSQNSFQQPQAMSVPISSDPWDLDKYVWSHAHPSPAKASKPLLDFNALENWMIIGPNEDCSISANGQYFAYSVLNAMYLTRDSLIVQSTNSSWRQSLVGASPGFFSGDSKQYICQDNKQLYLIQLRGQIQIIKDVASYQKPADNKGEWIAYHLSNREATLVLRHLPSAKEKRFDNVSGYSFDPSGSWLAGQFNNTTKELFIYNMATGKERRFPAVAAYAFDTSGQALVLKIIEGSHTALQYVRLLAETNHTIWSTDDSNASISSFTLDHTGKQVIFMVHELSSSSSAEGNQSSQINQPNNSLWYYQSDMEKAVLKVNNQTAGIEARLFIQGTPAFTPYDSRYIQFSLQSLPEVLPKPILDAAKMDIWSYKDTIPIPIQSGKLKQPARAYTSIIDPQDGKVIRLEREHERLWRNQGDFAVVSKSRSAELGDRFWEPGYYIDSIWLVSLKDGARTLLHIKKTPPTIWSFVWFSPSGNYLVYFDAGQECNYFSYNLTTGKVFNISSTIPAKQLGSEEWHYRRPPEKTRAVGIAIWLEHDSGLLIYDEYYDIWQLDLSGKKSPVNITNGYARKHNTRLKLLNAAPFLAVGTKDTLLLTAYNTQNRQTGLYRKVLGKAGYPEHLHSGDYNLEPVMAATDNTNLWIIKRQRADEAPNYFVSHDFKGYHPLSNLQAHKKYNWLTAELHSFKQLDGTMSQGILYKPENFDPTKKYPAIIVFYGTISNQLHIFPTPSFMRSPTTPRDSPGWLVSHGYLVFTPDIYFKKGQWGPSTLNTVEGAAKYLSALPFVDSKRLGACGHSNSGRTGFYVLTHSQSFAAMVVGEGTTNIISQALSLGLYDEGNHGRLEWVEVSAFGTGLGNLWQNKDSWLDQTSVLHADKVTSPLLLFDNKEYTDGGEQAIEMFTALRRLQKKVWWLHYDKGGHSLSLPGNMKDFTIRYTQYFDHYLKGAPPPSWMTQGIPTKYKQLESRYELIPKGSCGITCVVCQIKN